LAELVPEDDPRLVLGLGNNEDAAVLRFPAEQYLVQTVDFLTPIVDDPFAFGRIAAANALSDVFAMGGRPFAAMNIVGFPSKTMDVQVLREILRGGADAVHEAGAVLVGGHSVQDTEIKYGLSVSGVLDPQVLASNTGLRPGDHLLLTKPIGTGVLATAVKANWEGADAMEAELVRWAGRLNRVGGEAIARFGLRAATDVTGFGLVGHVLEMAVASRCQVVLRADAVPLLSGVRDLAAMGLLPEGSHANRKFCACRVRIAPHVDPLVADLLFDAQTSGGLVLAVPEAKRAAVRDFLLSCGDLAAEIGWVEGPAETGAVVVE
jgi:selenide,water dikinase